MLADNKGIQEERDAPVHHWWQKFGINILGALRLSSRECPPIDQFQESDNKPRGGG